MNCCIDYLPITKHLDRVGYDYLNLPKGDDVHDDGPIIQARAFVSQKNKGVSAIPRQGTHFVGTTIHLQNDCSIVGVP